MNYFWNTTSRPQAAPTELTAMINPDKPTIFYTLRPGEYLIKDALTNDFSIQVEDHLRNNNDATSMPTASCLTNRSFMCCSPCECQLSMWMGECLLVLGLFPFGVGFFILLHELKIVPYALFLAVAGGVSLVSGTSVLLIASNKRKE